MKNALLRTSILSISILSTAGCLVDANDPTAAAGMQLSAGAVEWNAGNAVVLDAPYFLQVAAAELTCDDATESAAGAMRAKRMAFARACGAARGTVHLATELDVLPLALPAPCFGASAPGPGRAAIALRAQFRRVGLICLGWDTGDIPHEIERCGDRIDDSDVLVYAGPVSSEVQGPITLDLTNAEATTAANAYFAAVVARAERECTGVRGTMVWDPYTGVTSSLATRQVQTYAAGTCVCRPAPAPRAPVAPDSR